MKLLIFSFIVGCLAHHGHASFSLCDIQPLIGFSDSCTAAYGTKITQCKGSQLALLSSDPSCSDDCYNELKDLTSTIQSACRGNGANPDTLIGHAFIGDLADFMCAQGAFASGATPSISSGTATNALSSTSASSAASTSDSDTSTTVTTSSTTASASSTSSESSSSSTTLTPSTTAQPSSSSSTSKTETPRSTSDSNSISDSTPFDQTVGANSASSLLRNPNTVGSYVSSYWWIVVGPLALATI